MCIVPVTMLGILEAKGLFPGSDAPSFCLSDQEGYYHSLGEHRGQFILLFFFPRTFIPYSVREVQAFEQNYATLKELGVVIYGINNEPVQNLHRFHKTFQLTFDLLSDPDSEVIKAYFAKGLFGNKFISYLIGPDGRIIRVYDKSSPISHPSLALNDLERTGVPHETITHLWSAKSVALDQGH